MPDILHWLGITKIDRMLSMSNMKYDAIVSQGIPIHERVPIPEDMIPEDGQVEIEAKVHAGYFAGQPGEVARWTGELDGVKGRGWDDIDVRFPVCEADFSIELSGGKRLVFGSEFRIEIERLLFDLGYLTHSLIIRTQPL
jgi:hypothetical protein